MAARFTGPLKNAERNGSGARAWMSGAPIGLASEPDYLVLDWDFLDKALDLTNNYSVIKDSSASVAIQDDARGGRVLISSQATTDDDGGALLCEEEVVSLTSGKQLWFEAKGQVSDADQMDVFVGLCETFATNPEACLTSSNRVGFQINDGNASILCKTEAADSETSSDSGSDAADATDVKLGFHWDGVSTVKFYIDRALVASHTATLPTSNLLPVLFHLSGNDTGTKTSSWDYIRIVMER